MKLVKTVIAFCTSFMLLQGAAGAAPAVDQINARVQGGFCSITAHFSCGQSFYQSAGNISGAGIFIAPAWYASDGTVSIGIFDTPLYSHRLFFLLHSA